MRIALVGSAPSSMHLAPWKDAAWKQYAGGINQNYPPAKNVNETWEIWGCSPGLFGHAERIHRWFEVHRWEPGQTWFSPEYCQFLREFDGPVYTGCPIPEIKNYVVYPIKEVEAEFGSYFLSSSLSLMFAIAIMEIEADRRARPTTRADGTEKDVIGLWGVDMAASEEWAMQRPGCHFFVHEALRRGISVYVPPESDLLRPEPVYGISEHSHQYIKMTAFARELNARIQQRQATIQEQQRQLWLEQGAMGQLNSHIKTWVSPYGLPHGIEISLIPGTGLGTGVNLVNGEPPPFVVPVDFDAATAKRPEPPEDGTETTS